MNDTNSTGYNPFSHARSADALFIDTIIGIITTLVFSVAFTENLILLLVIVKMVPLHNKPIQSLILSLAVADFLQSIFQQVPYAIDKLHHSWLMGSLVCKLYSSGRSVFQPTSLIIIAFIGVERYRSLQKSDGIAFSVRTTRLIIASAWLTCLVGALPQVAWFDVVVYPGGLRRCSYAVTFSSTVKVYTIVTRAVFFLTPTLMVWFSYMGVIYRIMKNSRKVMHMNGNSISGIKRKQTVIRVSRTCVLTALVYTLCSAPFNISLLYIVLSNGVNFQILTYTGIFTSLASCINPVIYGLTLRSFKEALFKLLACSTNVLASEQTATKSKENESSVHVTKTQWVLPARRQDGVKDSGSYPSDTTELDVTMSLECDDKDVCQPTSKIETFNAF